MSHKGLPAEDNEKSAWSMANEVYVLNKGESHKIDRSCKWAAVSLSSFFKFAKVQGVTLD